MKKWAKKNVDILVVAATSALAINEIYMSTFKTRSTVGTLTKIGLLVVDMTLMYHGSGLAAAAYTGIKESIKEVISQNGEY